MIYLNGAVAAIATANANPPPPALDWVDTISADYPIGGLSYFPGFDITLGTLFTTTQGGLCTGIKMRLGTDNGTDPNTIHFALFAIGNPVPLSQEIIPFNISMYGQIVQTTQAFAPINLQPATQYIAAVFISGGNGPYNYAADVSQAVPPYLPKSFPNYTINVGSQSAAGAGLKYPSNNNPQFANYFEPIIA